MSKDNGKRGCETRHIRLAENDLPLCCPQENERVWDAHPRVFLPVEEGKRTICPYCGTSYELATE